MGFLVGIAIAFVIALVLDRLGWINLNDDYSGGNDSGAPWDF